MRSGIFSINRYSNGTMVRLTASAHAFLSYNFDYDPDTGKLSARYEPESITVTAELQGGLVIGKWRYSTDGIIWKDIVSGEHGITLSDNTARVTSASDLFTAQGNSELVIRCDAADGIHYDTVTLSRMLDPTYAYVKNATAIERTDKKISLIATEEQYREYGMAGTTMATAIAQLTIEAGRIAQNVSENYELKTDAQAKYTAYDSAFEQTARQISSKVSTSDYTGAQIASLINQSAAEVKIQSAHIVLDGNVVLKSHLTDGITAISGANITTGYISAERIQANSIAVSKLTGSISNGNWNIDLTNGTFTIGNISAANITSGTISADRIAANSIAVSKLTGSISNGNWNIDLENGTFTIGNISAANIDVSNGKITASQIDVSNLQVAAANITGKLTASQINTMNLHVNAANIDGTIIANSVAANDITAGTLSAAVTATNLTMTGGRIAIDAGNNHSADASDNYISMKYGYILYDTTYKRTATFNSKAFRIGQTYDPSISIRYTTYTEQTEGKYTARQTCKSLVNGSTISDYYFEAGWEGIILTSNGSNIFKAVTDGSTQSSVNQVVLGDPTACGVTLPNGNTYIGNTDLNTYIDGRVTKTAVKEISITGITGATITAHYARYGNLCVINFTVTKSQTGTISTSKSLSGITGAKTNFPAYCGLSGYDNNGKVAGGHMWLDGTTLNIRISPTESATAYLRGVMVYSVS